MHTKYIVKQNDIKVLLTEPQYKSNAAEVIAAETGANIYEFDPVVTGKNNDGIEIYFEKMRKNGEILAKAFGEKR